MFSVLGASRIFAIRIQSYNPGGPRHDEMDLDLRSLYGKRWASLSFESPP